MRIDTIYCPVCRNKLRIPEDLMGQPVLCPSCQTEFIAPPPPAGGERPSEAIQERRPDELGSYAARAHDDQRGAYRDSDFHRTERPSPFVTMAAVALIGISLIALADNAIRLITFSAQDVQDAMMDAKKSFPMLQVPGKEELTKLYFIWGIVFGLVSVVGLFGGVAMLRRRFFPVAVAGGILAIFNVSADCCCLLGAPIGITCLILLFQPHVRASFHSQAGS